MAPTSQFARIFYVGIVDGNAKMYQDMKVSSSMVFIPNFNKIAQVVSTTVESVFESRTTRQTHAAYAK